MCEETDVETAAILSTEQEAGKQDCRVVRSWVSLLCDFGPVMVPL